MYITTKVIWHESYLCIYPHTTHRNVCMSGGGQVSCDIQSVTAWTHSVMDGPYLHLMWIEIHASATNTNVLIWCVSGEYLGLRSSLQHPSYLIPINSEIWNLNKFMDLNIILILAFGVSVGHFSREYKNIIK